MSKNMSKKNTFKIFVPALAVLGLLFAAPITVFAQDAGADRSAGQVVDDVWITTQVSAKYALEKGISVFDIKVESYDGVVHLSGIVSNEAEKSLAEALAREVDHVKDVVNNIVVEAGVVLVPIIVTE